jgi:hypothetical protein
MRRKLRHVCLDLMIKWIEGSRLHNTVQKEPVWVSFCASLVARNLVNPYGRGAEEGEASLMARPDG